MIGMEGTERKKMKFTKGDIRTVVKVAWPSALESFFIALAGMVDTYMVSGLDKAAVAAVGLTTQPKFIGLSLVMALKISISALVARRFGQKDQDKANAILSMGLIFTIVSSILISVLSVVYADPIMRLVGSQEDTHAYAVTYFRIIMGGMIFNAIQITINAALRGTGNTKIAMRTNVTANIVNVIGNYLLIEGHLGFPAMGITGAAVATVFGTVVACGMSIVSVCKKDGYISLFYIVKKKLVIAKDQIGTMCKLGFSELGELLLVRVGFLLTALLAANLGTDAMAAHQVGLNVMSLSFSFGDGLSVAAVALIGRSLGEKKPDRAKQYGNVCLVFGLAISVVLAMAYIAFGRPFYELFFEEELIVDIGVKMMGMMSIIVLMQVSQCVLTGSLRGAGDMIHVMIVGAVSVSVMRPAVSYLCAYPLEMGIIGIWCGVLADQMLRLILNGKRYQSGKWMKIKI